MGSWEELQREQGTEYGPHCHGLHLHQLPVPILCTVSASFLRWELSNCDVYINEHLQLNQRWVIWPTGDGGGEADCRGDFRHRYGGRMMRGTEWRMVKGRDGCKVPYQGLAVLSTGSLITYGA